MIRTTMSGASGLLPKSSAVEAAYDKALPVLVPEN